VSVTMPGNNTTSTQYTPSDSQSSDNTGSSGSSSTGSSKKELHSDNCTAKNGNYNYTIFNDGSENLGFRNETTSKIFNLNKAGDITGILDNGTKVNGTPKPEDHNFVEDIKDNLVNGLHNVSKTKVWQI